MVKEEGVLGSAPQKAGVVKDGKWIVGGVDG
jgi:hypothetical protein